MRKGSSHSLEARKRMSESRKGKHLSEETRRRISEARKGKPLSVEHRRRISEALKGKSRSLETRKKMSEAHKGSHHSLGSRRRMSKVRKRKKIFYSKTNLLILTVLKNKKEATVRELSIKTKINNSTLYSLLKKLEKYGKVKHRYLRVAHSQRYVKHYQMI